MDLVPEIPAEISAIVNLMLKKDPDQRYLNAQEIITDLTLVLNGQAPATALVVSHEEEAPPQLYQDTNTSSLRLSEEDIPEARPVPDYQEEEELVQPQAEVASVPPPKPPPERPKPKVRKKEPKAERRDTVVNQEEQSENTMLPPSIRKRTQVNLRRKGE